MGAKQLNIFDVLRGFTDENSETYKATIKILTNYRKDLPPPDDGYIPPSFNEAKQPPRASSGIRIPSPPPKAISWLSRNWPWLVFGGTIIGIIICLYVRKHRRNKQEEKFRKREAARLPIINYPWPSEASGPIIMESPPGGPSLIEMHFEELDREKPMGKVEPPEEVSPKNKGEGKPK